jgi:predicted transcriptional regulator
MNKKQKSEADAAITDLIHQGYIETYEQGGETRYRLTPAGEEFYADARIKQRKQDGPTTFH